MQGLMGTTEPSGRHMHWKLRFNKFFFNIMYKKGNLNTQIDALSWLTSVEETTASLDENISIQTKQTALLSISGVSDYIVLTCEDLTVSPLVPVTSAEMLSEQKNDLHYRDIVARLHIYNSIAFLAKANKNIVPHRLRTRAAVCA